MMNSKIAEGDRITKMLFRTLMVLAIARSAVWLYDRKRRPTKKVGCGCKGKV